MREGNATRTAIRLFSAHFTLLLLNHTTIPSKTTEIEAKVDAIIAAMDANLQLKAKDAAYQFNALYQ